MAFVRIMTARWVLSAARWIAELIAPEIITPVPSIADKYPYGTHDAKPLANQ